MNTLPHLTQAIDRHLTDEQMFDLLNEPNRTATALRLHLSTCSACRVELTSLSESLANFRAAATNLAGAQAAVFAPRPAAVQRPRTTLRRNIWAASFATAAAVFAVSVSLVQPRPHVPNAPQTPAAAAVPTAQPSVSDEALLDGIQQDLSTSIPPSLEPLAVPAASGDTNNQN